MYIKCHLGVMLIITTILSYVNFLLALDVELPQSPTLISGLQSLDTGIFIWQSVRIVFIFKLLNMVNIH